MEAIRYNGFYIELKIAGEPGWVRFLESCQVEEEGRTEKDVEVYVGE
jgi:hypothetical protein